MAVLGVPVPPLTKLLMQEGQEKWETLDRTTRCSCSECVDLANTNELQTSMGNITVENTRWNAQGTILEIITNLNNIDGTIFIIYSFKLSILVFLLLCILI